MMFFLERIVGQKIIVGMLALFMAICSMSMVSYASDETSPLVQVKVTVEKVIGILQDEKFQGEEQRETRRSLVLKEICDRFDFQLMAKLSLGDVWERISDEQKEEFTQLFSNLLKSTYIQRVESYSNEKVMYGEELIKNNVAQVSSIFVKNNNRLSVIYRLRKESDTHWLVYDVVIEGASLIKQYRRQFSQVIDQEEFSGLIARLKDKVKAIDCKI